MKSSFPTAVAVLLVTAVLSSCKRKTETTRGQIATAAAVDSAPIDSGPAVPSGDLREPVFHFAIGIFSTPGATKIDTDGIVRGMVRDKGIAIHTELPDRPTNDLLAILRHPSIAEYAPPSAENLQYFARGLSDAEQRALINAKAVTALFFSGPPAEAARTYRLAIAIGAAVAKVTGGLVYDDDTRLSYNEASWRATLDKWEPEIPDIADNIVIHMYQDGELLRLVTLGMGKFALPDISVNQVSSHDAPTMGTLINLACQTLVERSTVDEGGLLAVSIDTIRSQRAKASLEQDLLRGATKKATLRIADAVAHEGDADNRLVEIVFPGPAGQLQERQNALLSTFFGSKDDIVGVKHDAELLAASESAKLAARRYKARFAHGAPQQEQLMVKGPFTTAHDSVEWMWIEVLRWQGKTIHGVLQSDPYDVPELKPGARVDVNEDSIFDYIYRGADGGVEGNETARLIQAREPVRPRPD
jgi:uncharacterized protein YegJ (DUF2314 family)